MSISDRRASALRAAKRAPKQQLRAFVTHYINTRAIGPQQLPEHRGTHPFVHRLWTHPNGKLTADGVIVGRAFMEQDIT